MYKLQFFPKYWGFVQQKKHICFMLWLKILCHKIYNLKNVLYVCEIYTCKIQYSTILIVKYFTHKYCIFQLVYFIQNFVRDTISFNSITTLKVVIFSDEKHLIIYWKLYFEYILMILFTCVFSLLQIIHITKKVICIYH